MNFTQFINFRKSLFSVTAALFFGCAGIYAQDYSPIEAKIDTALSLQKGQHFNESTALLNSLSDQISETLPEKLRFKYYQNLAYNLFIVWELQKAEYASKSAVNIAENSKDSSLMVRAYSVLGNIYAKQKREQQSIFYQKKALNLLGPTDSTSYYGLLVNITNSLSKKQDNNQALSNLIQAKRFYKRRGNFQGLGLVENNIGELYRSVYHDYTKAILHYRLAQKVNSENEFKKNLVQNYHNLGLVFLKLNEIDSALTNVQKSIRLRKSIGDEAGTVHGYNLMGDVYLKTDKYDRAIQSYTQMLKISEQYGIDPGIYYSHIGLAAVYEAKSENSETLKQYKQAKRVSDLMKSDEIQQDIANKLYTIYKQQGDFKNALLAHENLLALDSVEKQTQNQELLDELKIKYENKLALSENERLRTREKSRTQQLANQRNTLIYLWVGLILVLLLAVFLFIAYRQRQKAYSAMAAARLKLEQQYETTKRHQNKLEKANELKNLIFSVIGHDLREPLTALSQILTLANSGDLSKGEMDVLFHHIQGQTDKNIKSLQDILLWAKTQINHGTINQTEFNAEDELVETIEKNREAIDRKKIHVVHQIEGSPHVWADLNQFRSIVQNLLSNAIKFSPAGEKIHVSIVEESAGFVLKVKDLGAGVSTDFLKEINQTTELITTRGTEGEVGTGIGLRLINEFTKAHRGSFYFTENQPSGTIAVVVFPNMEAFKKLDKLTDAA